MSHGKIELQENRELVKIANFINPRKYTHIDEKADLIANDNTSR